MEFDKKNIIYAEKLVKKLSELSELLLVDWCWSEVYPLSDIETIIQYLKRRENIFNA